MSPRTPAPPSAARPKPGHDMLTSQLGQMILTGFAGVRPGDDGVRALRERAERGEVGGIILFSYNIEGPEQLRALVAHIRSWQVPAPLIISVDQEGGVVQRMRPAQGFRGWPSPHDLAQMPAPAAHAAMDGMAAELRDYGINFDFAPCVDLHDARSPVIGALGRSYGTDPARVAQLAARQAQALGAHGVGVAIKHFPGHGSARGDTHHGLTDVTEHWDRRELQPFERLIAGPHVDAVMTSHLVQRHLDASGDPTTFSRPVVHDLLRGELAYDGLVVTDDLGMGALVHDYGLETIVERAVAAGHDLLVFGQNAAAAGRGERGHAPIPNLLPMVVQTVQQGIAQGQIDAAAIRRSAARIIDFKRRVLSPTSR
jgi:beta-N-acetylhexosaminidase